MGAEAIVAPLEATFVGTHIQTKPRSGRRGSGRSWKRPRSLRSARHAAGRRGDANREKCPCRKLVSREEQTMKLTDWGESARSTSWPLWPVITLTIGVAGLLLWILMMGRAIWNLLGFGILW